MLHNNGQKKKNKITFENDIDLILNSFDIFFKTFECYMEINRTNNISIHWNLTVFFFFIIIQNSVNSNILICINNVLARICFDKLDVFVYITNSFFQKFNITNLF
jgi:hypothetical protein